VLVNASVFGSKSKDSPFPKSPPTKICGGALLPPLLGVISDATGSIQNGYIIPLLCFVVVFLFATKGYKVKSV
jgi:hypothetical protein